MSYIGRGIDQIDNISTLDNLTFNGSLQTFNLTQNSVAFVLVSADALQIQIDGVIQSGNYTVSGSTVTFDFTPSGSSVCNGIKHFGVGIITSVSDGAVTTAKLGADSVNGSKIADNSISDEHLDITAITGQTAITSLADTDKFLVSDASDSGNLKYVEKQYLGGGDFVRLGSIDQDLGTSQKIRFEQVFASDYDHYRLIGSANVGSNQQAEVYFRWLNSSNAELYVASYAYAGYGRYSNTDDSGGTIGFQKMSETFVTLLDDFHGGSYGRAIFFDMTFYPRINPSNFRSGFQGQISYNAYNSGNGGWNATNIGGFYAEDTDLSGGGLQIECNTSWDYVRMNLYGVKNS